MLAAHIVRYAMGDLPMKVDVTVSRLDLLKGQLRLIPRLRANYIFLALLWVTGSVINFGLAAEFGVPVYLIVVTLFAFVAFTISMTFCIGFAILMASEKHGSLGQHTFEITDDAFVEDTLATSTATKWAGIQKLWSFRAVSYILISGYRFHVIPARAFDTKDGYRTFVDQISTRISSS
ncbi:MAG: YcxB family protein [Pseudomonadota bacterium]